MGFGFNMDLNNYLSVIKIVLDNDPIYREQSDCLPGMLGDLSCGDELVKTGGGE